MGTLGSFSRYETSRSELFTTITYIPFRRIVWSVNTVPTITNIVTSLHPVLICVWCHLTLARTTSAHVCGTSVVLGPWYSVRVLIQHSVITLRATSMADTDINAINNKKRVQFLSCDRSTRSCICPCRQNITDTHKRHIHNPVLLSQDRNYTCFFSHKVSLHTNTFFHLCTWRRMPSASNTAETSQLFTQLVVVRKMASSECILQGAKKKLNSEGATPETVGKMRENSPFVSLVRRLVCGLALSCRTWFIPPV